MDSPPFPSPWMGRNLPYESVFLDHVKYSLSPNPFTFEGSNLKEEAPKVSNKLGEEGTNLEL